MRALSSGTETKIAHNDVEHRGDRLGRPMASTSRSPAAPKPSVTMKLPLIPEQKSSTPSPNGRPASSMSFLRVVALRSRFKRLAAAGRRSVAGCAAHCVRSPIERFQETNHLHSGHFERQCANRARRRGGQVLEYSRRCWSRRATFSRRQMDRLPQRSRWLGPDLRHAGRRVAIAVQITKGQFEAWRPEWSHDSQKIVFDSNSPDHPGDRQISIANIGKIRRTPQSRQSPPDAAPTSLLSGRRTTRLSFISTRIPTTPPICS